jgi:hypothetical protein
VHFSSIKHFQNTKKSHRLQRGTALTDKQLAQRKRINEKVAKCCLKKDEPVQQQPMAKRKTVENETTLTEETVKTAFNEGHIDEWEKGFCLGTEEFPGGNLEKPNVTEKQAAILERIEKKIAQRRKLRKAKGDAKAQDANATSSSSSTSSNNSSASASSSTQGHVNSQDSAEFKEMVDKVLKP